MKKLLLVLAFGYAVLTAYGQSPIPNGDFESWTSGTFDNPQNYPNTSNSQEFYQNHLPFNVTKTTQAYHGTYAVQLTTNASATDTVFGFFIDINPQNNPATWTGGMAYAQKPVGIRGWYKYNVATADSGTIIVTFSKNGSNIGSYFYRIGGIHSDYTLFNFTFNPALSATPDSVAFGALSCRFALDQQQPHGPAGSMLTLDSVSFTGVNSQPAMLNGDFELWQNQTLYTPDSWYLQSDNGDGVSRTEDAATGNYALELKTFAGNQNNHPTAQPGKLSTGRYPNNCNGNCVEKGGYPFSNQIDTLAFSYKFAPAHPGDSAWITVNFKKNSSLIWTGGTYLLASANYTYRELPFNLPAVPDSVMIDIQSSVYKDSAISYVGADLKIDDILFRSQIVPTGISNNTGNAISVFPNPTTGLLQIKGLRSDVQQFEIYNESGRLVYAASGENRQLPNVIDLSKFQKGIYLIKIHDGKTTQTKKFVIQ